MGILAGDWATTTCWKCGILFAAPSHWMEARRNHKDEFWCPNGHKAMFGEGEIDRLRRERDRLKQDAARLEEEKASALKAYDHAKAETARIKKRVGAGSCPCCKRNFANVARHMKSKHPEIVPFAKKA